MLNTFQAELLGSCLGHTYIGAVIREGFHPDQQECNLHAVSTGRDHPIKFKATATSLMKG
jgi:hypothetical protein